MRDDGVELGGEGCEIGGGEGEEGGEGVCVRVEEGVVTVLVGLVRSGVDDGLGGPEAGEGSVPNSDRAGLAVPDLALPVIPDLIRDPSSLRRGEGLAARGRRRWTPDRARGDGKGRARRRQRLAASSGRPRERRGAPSRGRRLERRRPFDYAARQPSFASLSGRCGVRAGARRTPCLGSFSVIL